MNPVYNNLSQEITTLMQDNADVVDTLEVILQITFRELYKQAPAAYAAFVEQAHEIIDNI